MANSKGEWVEIQVLTLYSPFTLTRGTLRHHLSPATNLCTHRPTTSSDSAHPQPQAYGQQVSCHVIALQGADTWWNTIETGGTGRSRSGTTWIREVQSFCFPSSDEVRFQGHVVLSCGHLLTAT